MVAIHILPLIVLGFLGEVLCFWLRGSSILHWWLAELLRKCRAKGVSSRMLLQFKLHFQIGQIIILTVILYHSSCLHHFLLETLKIWTLDKHLTLKSREAKNFIKVKDIFILKLQFCFQHLSFQQGFNIFAVHVISVHIFGVHVFDLHVIHVLHKSKLKTYYGQTKTKTVGETMLIFILFSSSFLFSNILKQANMHGFYWDNL